MTMTRAALVGRLAEGLPGVVVVFGGCEARPCPPKGLSGAAAASPCGRLRCDGAPAEREEDRYGEWVKCTDAPIGVEPSSAEPMSSRGRTGR
jgi:hypothetical protein